MKSKLQKQIEAKFRLARSDLNIVSANMRSFMRHYSEMYGKEPDHAQVDYNELRKKEILCQFDLEQAEMQLHRFNQSLRQALKGNTP